MLPRIRGLSPFAFLLVVACASQFSAPLSPAPSANPSSVSHPTEASLVVSPTPTETQAPTSTSTPRPTVTSLPTNTSTLTVTPTSHSDSHATTSNCCPYPTPFARRGRGRPMLTLDESRSPGHLRGAHH